MEKTRKRSKKRDAILACIRSTRRHPSAEWIYDRPHAHLICQCCGEVIDLPGLASLEAMAGQAEALTGGRIEGCAVTFSGLCRSCVKTR